MESQKSKSLFKVLLQEEAASTMPAPIVIKSKLNATRGDLAAKKRAVQLATQKKQSELKNTIRRAYKYHKQHIFVVSTIVLAAVLLIASLVLYIIRLNNDVEKKNTQTAEKILLAIGSTLIFMIIVWWIFTNYKSIARIMRPFKRTMESRR